MLTLAGAVIVSEAGGVVLDPNGKDFDIMSRRILVASTQKLVDEWKNKVDYQCKASRRDFPEICPMWIWKYGKQQSKYVCLCFVKYLVNIFQLHQLVP